MQSEGVIHTLSLLNCSLEDKAEIKFVSKTAETAAHLTVIGKLESFIFRFSFCISSKTDLLFVHRATCGVSEAATRIDQL